MIALFASVALVASPMIFRSDYLSEKPPAVRPMQKSLLGLSLKQINDFRRAQNGNVTPPDFCYLEAMRRDALVVTEREGQQQLERLYGDVPNMSFDLTTKDGIRLTVGI